jgi:hypothetical protein
MFVHWRLRLLKCTCNVQGQLGITSQDPEDCEAGDLIFYEAATAMGIENHGKRLEKTTGNPPK